MVDTQPTETPASDDLRHIVHVGRARCAHLLLPEEEAVLDQILQLAAQPLEIYARWARRRSEIQRRDMPCSEALEAAGLLTASVTPEEHVAHATIAELQAVIRLHGHKPRRGRRAVLQAQAIELRAEPSGWVRIHGRALLLRLHRACTLRAFPDPDTRVLERMGVRTWPDYELTSGALVWTGRAHLEDWEAAARTNAAEELLQAIDAPHSRAPGRLDLRPHLRRALFDHATSQERTDPRAARTIYTSLAEQPGVRRDRARLRLAQLLDRDGQSKRALRLLREARPDVSGPSRRALHRTGRRLARACRAGWAPDAPSPVPRSRRVTLTRVPSDDPRPLFETPVGPQPVEEATIAWLHTQGRTAIHAEGRLWRHVFALLFAPHCYFESVPGALPASHLSGPLDLGTPQFATARPAGVERTLHQIDEDPGCLALETHARFAGTRLAGARWDRCADDDAALVRAIAPLLRPICTTLLARGLRAAKGLPDLLVLPGEVVRLRDAHPRSIPAGPLLAEVKTVNDTLSDAQRWWLATLHHHARIEVWRVHARGHRREG